MTNKPTVYPFSVTVPDFSAPATRPSTLHSGKAALISQIAVLTVIAALSGCRTQAPGQPQAQAITTTAAPQTQDLHFSPADIAYLESVDAPAREIAIQRRRDEVKANHEMANLTKGYTDSLKHWSISTSTARQAHRK
jgi:hypothetical protein